MLAVDFIGKKTDQLRHWHPERRWFRGIEGPTLTYFEKPHFAQPEKRMFNINNQKLCGNNKIECVIDDRRFFYDWPNSISGSIKTQSNLLSVVSWNSGVFPASWLFAAELQFQYVHVQNLQFRQHKNKHKTQTQWKFAEIVVTNVKTEKYRNIAKRQIYMWNCITAMNWKNLGWLIIAKFRFRNTNIENRNPQFTTQIFLMLNERFVLKIFLNSSGCLATGMPVHVGHMLGSEKKYSKKSLNLMRKKTKSHQLEMKIFSYNLIENLYCQTHLSRGPKNFSLLIGVIAKAKCFFRPLPFRRKQPRRIHMGMKRYFRTELMII